MAEPPRASLSGHSLAVVHVPKPERQFVDAPEPGTYQDPFTGKLKRQRPPANGAWWWGDLLDRVRR